MFEWSDIRLFIATARLGGTHAAGRELGLAQTTVARRLAALEEALGLRLFDRTAGGYRLTEAGAAVLPQAERVAFEAEGFLQKAAGERRGLSGVVRITTTEAIANVVLTPLLSEFIETYPDIRVEVVVSEARLDLARGEADVSLRATRRIEEPGVVFRKLADGPWALYCSRSYAERRGRPSNAEELGAHRVIGADGDLAALEPHRWLAEHARGASWRTVSSNMMNSLAAMKAGHGIGPLPTSVGDGEPSLVRCFRLPSFGYGYFMVTAATRKDVPRVRALTSFIAERSATLRKVLEGEP